ncbi:hypothetical protein [Actinomyces oris]|uniref:hypothetical protein n=1 Tax=Actinomyces oris TaxID=544580 RepID=UPI000A884A0A|nr:hypothetical protein [Actinomyces oris]
MSDWYCCLLCEGSSDGALANVLEVLLTQLTCEPASVSARLDLKGSVEAKLGTLQKNDAELYDLIFIHRDADNAGLKARINEIGNAVGAIEFTHPVPVVPVVPVTMTETWALASLLDDQECGTWLRREASLSESTLENRKDTKRLLHHLLSRHIPNGELLDIGTFSVQRAKILAELNTANGSTLSRLNAWKTMLSEIQNAIHRARPWIQNHATQ